MLDRMNVALESILAAKHSDAIWEVFSDIFPADFSDDDRASAISMFLMFVGKSVEQLDQEIQTGINNGYPVGVQIELCKRLFATI